MPSPVYVADTVKLGDTNSYAKALRETDSVMTAFAKLDPNEKHATLSSWWKSVKESHRSLSKRESVHRSGAFGYFPTRAMCKADLTKLDLLFLAEGQEPVFHTSEFLIALYSINVGEPKSVPTQIRFVPAIYEGKNPNAYEPAFPSFDAFHKGESELVTSWIENSFRNPRPPAMTPRIMNKKRSDFRD